MKLKLSQSSRNIALLVENYGKHLTIYYADKHSEVLKTDIKEYYIRGEFNGYKKPISFCGVKLYPTINQRSIDCCWINLSYFEENDLWFSSLLKEKSLFHIAKKMYVKEKKKQIL